MSIPKKRRGFIVTGWPMRILIDVRDRWHPAPITTHDPSLWQIELFAAAGALALVAFMLVPIGLATRRHSFGRHRKLNRVLAVEVGLAVAGIITVTWLRLAYFGDWPAAYGLNGNFPEDTVKLELILLSLTLKDFFLAVSAVTAFYAVTSFRHRRKFKDSLTKGQAATLAVAYGVLTIALAAMSAYLPAQSPWG
jgi:hypothetical protein